MQPSMLLRPDLNRANVRWLASRWLVRLIVLGLAGCVQPVGVPPATTLSRAWLVGVERMRDDAGPQLPFTNRFIADLSAMPKLNVVYVNDDRYSFLFNTSRDERVLISPWLHSGGHCMDLTYTVYQS